MGKRRKRKYEIIQICMYTKENENILRVEPSRNEKREKKTLMSADNERATSLFRVSVCVCAYLKSFFCVFCVLRATMLITLNLMLAGYVCAGALKIESFKVFIM